MSPVNHRPWLIFVLLASVVLLAWWSVHRHRQESVRQQIEIAADQAAVRIEDFLQTRLLVVDSLRQSARQGELQPGADFVSRSLIVQEQFPGFQALNWIDSEGVLATVTPLVNNREALGKNVLDHPVAYRAFRHARDTGTPKVTGALELFQGGRGFASYFPIVVSGATTGYINGVFRIEPIVRRALRGRLLEGYLIKLLDHDGNSLLTPSERAPLYLQRPQATAEVRLLDNAWSLTIWPREALWSNLRAGRTNLVFVIALGLTAMISWLVHLAARRQVAQAEAERERFTLEHRLQRATKMESLGRLAGGIAHDFNNILTTVMCNAELIRDGRDSDTRAAYLEEIVEAARQAGELTQQLLSFSRQAPVPPQRVDVNTELERVHAMLRRLVPENIEFELSPGSDLPPITCSPTHLGQIIVNLVINGVDAIGKQPGRIQVTTGVSRHGVAIDVTDDGVGMDGATRERAFDPFYSTKREGRGSGLGLSTVYGLVQTYEGQIDLVSAPGQGTSAKIWFPARPDASLTQPSEPQDESRHESAATIARPGKVLVVEDHAPIRVSLATSLTTLGYTCLEAEDGDAALRLLYDGIESDIEAVITDVVMPNLSGVELLEAIRERRRDLPVVLISGYTQQPLRLQRDPFTRFLGKPFSAERLHDVLQSLVGRG